jgi:hypothetical protein
MNYLEGDWFAVPLGPGGYVAGIVARANKRRATILAYFFGPPRPELPVLAELATLAAADALLVCTCSHLGLAEGAWPVIGKPDDWDRTKWPMPIFKRSQELTGQFFRVYYNDDDPAQQVRAEQIPRSLAEGLPEDGLMGYEFVEKRLARLLS